METNSRRRPPRPRTKRQARRPRPCNMPPRQLPSLACNRLSGSPGSIQRTSINQRGFGSIVGARGLNDGASGAVGPGLRETSIGRVQFRGVRSRNKINLGRGHFRGKSHVGKNTIEGRPGMRGAQDQMFSHGLPSQRNPRAGTLWQCTREP